MTEEQIVRAVDAAMVEMENIHPPLRRSECERLIRAAFEATRPKAGVLPSGVYYSRDHDNFYDNEGKGMGELFYSLWKEQRHKFPQHATAVT